MLHIVNNFLDKSSSPKLSQVKATNQFVEYIVITNKMPLQVATERTQNWGKPQKTIHTKRNCSVDGNDKKLPDKCRDQFTEDVSDDIAE